MIDSPVPSQSAALSPLRADLSPDFLLATGKKILECVNFSLFNARPTRKRVSWCYYELKDLGYLPSDLEEPFQKIPEFFEKRTVDNQPLLLRRMFGVQWNDELAAALILRYQHVEISEEQIEKTAQQVQALLEEVADLKALGMDFELFRASLKMNYTLQHYEDFDEFTLARLFDCLREQAERFGLPREVSTQLDQVLRAIDPAKKKALTPAELDWLLETVMVSGETELQPYRIEIKGLNEHPPELEKLLKVVESFNLLLERSRTGESPLSSRAANRLRELILKSADGLLEANMKTLE